MTLSVPSFLAAATSASMPPNAEALVAVLAFWAAPLGSLAGGAHAARPTTADATAHAARPRRERVRTQASSIRTSPRGPRRGQPQTTRTALRQLVRNAARTGATTLGLIMWVCPGRVSSRAFGTAWAIAACALRRYAGRLAPASTSVGYVTPS